MNPLFVIRYFLLGKFRIRLLCLILFAAAGLLFASEQAVAIGVEGDLGLSKSKLQALEQRLETITDPAAKLFFKAGVEQAKGEPEQALQTLSALIVHHAHDEKWIARAELLSAELYVELGLLDAADVTARQVQVLYEGTAVVAQASDLRLEIEKMKAEMETK